MNFYDTIKGRASHSYLNIFNINDCTAETIAEFDYVIEAPNWSKHDELFFNANGKLYKLDLTSKEYTEVNTYQADTCNNDHVLCPTDDRIAVSSGRNGDLLSQIYIIDQNEKSCTQVTSLPYSYLHGWSPDGKYLAYCAAREYDGNMEWDVYSISIDEGVERRLTTAEGLNDGPEYSPDGSYIWFNSMRTGLMQIWRMRTDGSDQIQMTFDKEMNSWFPHISPDMKKVVYISYHKEDLEPGEHLPDKNVEIRMISADGGEEKTLLTIFGGQGSMNVNSWSPDSMKFAFVSYS